MHYVYILFSKKDSRLYTGCTQDLKQRIQLHNKGKVLATRKRFPFDLIFYEAFFDKYDAFLREQWLKTGWGRNHINNALRPTFMKLKAKF